jgi:DNA-binding NarL/FixJ family response regulator
MRWRFKMERKHIHVLVADDTDIARIGLRNMLLTAKDIQVIGETDSVYSISRLIEELSPDLLLIDLRWHDDDSAGWMQIREIKKENSEIKVIAMTSYPNLIADAWKAGADQVVSKNLRLEELLELIRTIFERNESLPLKSGTFHGGLQDQISPRELEVLKLIDKGFSDKEISTKLSIQVNTAKNHVKSILEKLNAGNRRKAVIIAREHGIIE